MLVFEKDELVLHFSCNFAKKTKKSKYYILQVNKQIFVLRRCYSTHVTSLVHASFYYFILFLDSPALFFIKNIYHSCQ
jgi:hypothetical protein